MDQELIELEMDLYAEELPDVMQFAAISYSTIGTLTTVSSASCPTSTASSGTTASSLSW